jgi:hypothetical protein
MSPLVGVASPKDDRDHEHDAPARCSGAGAGGRSHSDRRPRRPLVGCDSRNVRRLAPAHDDVHALTVRRRDSGALVVHQLADGPDILHLLGVVGWVVLQPDRRAGLSDLAAARRRRQCPAESLGVPPAVPLRGARADDHSRAHVLSRRSHRGHGVRRRGMPDAVPSGRAAGGSTERPLGHGVLLFRSVVVRAADRVRRVHVLLPDLRCSLCDDASPLLDDDSVRSGCRLHEAGRARAAAGPGHSLPGPVP